MLTLFRHEIKENVKSLLIWALSVGGLGLCCILLYESMEGSMADMAESFAQLGAFSEAFGMTRLSIATLAGFYATEVGTVHPLGGAMFAAIVGTVMLSKEEDGHTGEFLLTLPICRKKVAAVKYLAVLFLIILFNIVCVLLYVAGFMILGEHIEWREFIIFHLLQTVMQLQIGSMCFLLSACTKKNLPGVGLGIALLLYVFDLMSRVIPMLEDYQWLTPYSYANAADIFSTGEVYRGALLFGLIIILLSVAGAVIIYNKKDLAA